MNALITGCASGFGLALCRRLLSLGWSVWATDPDPDAVHDALGEAPGLLIRRLDVREPHHVAAVAVELVQLHLLVNNGGYAVFGTQEEADLGAITDLFAVNVLGVARVTQALLPAVRAARGTVVNLSSVAGRVVFPESGYYAATKHAVEAMSDALFQEAGPLGVKVRVIRPGSFDTQFLDTARARSKPRQPASPYAAQHASWDERKLAVLEAPQDPELVVDAIIASLGDPRPFSRVAVGADAVRLLDAHVDIDPAAWRSSGE